MRERKRHLIDETINLNPPGRELGFHWFRSVTTKINEELARYGLRILSLGFERGPDALHVSVSAWYKQEAYNLIDKVIDDHEKEIEVVIAQMN